MVQGQVFLKGRDGGGGGGGWHFCYLIVSRFISELLYPLQKCVMHLKKNYFFCHHNFMKTGHSKLSKNEPENIP